MFNTNLYIGVDSNSLLEYRSKGLDRLQEVLQEIPAFRNKNDLIPMYVAYEFPE